MITTSKSVKLDTNGTYWVKDNEFHFTALGVSDEFACDYIMDVLIPQVNNTNLTFRHRHTLSSPDKIIPCFGKAVRAEKVELEKDGVKRRFLRTEFTVPLKAPNGRDLDENIIYAEWVKKCYEEGNTAGISYHFQVYKENDKAYYAVLLEIAGTPYPRCDECRIQAPQVGEVSMNEKEKQELQKMDSSQLQAILEKLTLELEGKNKIIAEKQKEVAELDSKHKMELETQKSSADKALRMLEDLSKEFTALKLELDFARTRKPIIDEILKLEGEPEFEEFYRTKDVAWLQKRLEKVSQPKLQTSRLDPGSMVAAARKKLEDEEPSQEQIMKNLPPNLAKDYRKLMEGRA